jgi:hypothetical protein
MIEQGDSSLMSTGLRAETVSARVYRLISRHDRGDADAAARRLGLTRERLLGLLSGDWRLFSLDALAALVSVYQVSAAWLITGETDGPNDETTAGS